MSYATPIAPLLQRQTNIYKLNTKTEINKRMNEIPISPSAEKLENKFSRPQRTKN